MTEEDVAKLVAVMKSYERKSKLPHYNMWGKATSSYKFKVEEFRLVAVECPKARGSKTLALDAGCGYGVYSQMLSKKGYAVVALDVSTGMIRKARELVDESNVWFVRGSITHLPLKENKFNFVLCVDTLHHLTDSFIDQALDEFRRVTKSGGVFITDTRNALNPAVSLQYWIKNRKWAAKGGLTLKARTLRNIKKKLSKHGFRVDKSSGIGWGSPALAPYIVVISGAV